LGGFGNNATSTLDRLDLQFKISEAFGAGVMLWKKLT
jgi:hypothetical protein